MTASDPLSNPYKSLGVRRRINAAGALTRLGGGDVVLLHILRSM